MKRLVLILLLIQLFLVSCNTEVKDYNKDALFYIRQQNFTEALNILNEALTVDDKNDVTWNNISVCYEAIGEYELALEAARNAVNYGDEKAAEYANLGNAYFDLGYTEEAKLAFEQALNLDEKHFFALYGLGVYYNKKEDYEKSQTYFQGLYDDNPMNVDVVQYIAYNKYKMGKIDDAIVFLEIQAEKVSAPSLDILLEKIKAEQ